MSDDKHDFSDYNEHAGIFGAASAGMLPALQEHDSVRSRIHPEGCRLEYDCFGCGLPTAIMIEWPEAVAMKYFVNPYVAFKGRPGILSGEVTSWTLIPHEQAWSVEARCSKCNMRPGLRVRPDEPERWLKEGRRRGYVDMQAERQVSELCAQIAQQMTQARALPRR